MALAYRLSNVAFITAFIVVLTYLHKLRINAVTRADTKGKRMYENFVSRNLPTLTLSPNDTTYRMPAQPGPPLASLSTKFNLGPLKSQPSNYARILVIPRLKNDDVSWIEDELFPIDTAIYIADDTGANLHPPMNKGHEVIMYLTYIIDHYFRLPDTVIFMHAHRWTHHNIELLGFDSAEMVRRLSNDYVAQEGYVNMRCRWYPGCPEWLHPSNDQETLVKQEAIALSKSWHELFPSEPLPESLGQGCCAQFAVSKDRVLSIPRSRFIFYRDWILRTPLSDYVSGRIWEYLWQFLFTGRPIHCPSEHVCHCLGFGVCFEGEDQYQEFETLRRKKESYEVELRDLNEQRLRNHVKEHNDSMISSMDVTSERERQSKLTDKIRASEKEMEGKSHKAMNQGAFSDGRAELSLEKWLQRKDF